MNWTWCYALAQYHDSQVFVGSGDQRRRSLWGELKNDRCENDAACFTPVFADSYFQCCDL